MYNGLIVDILIETRKYIGKFNYDLAIKHKNILEIVNLPIDNDKLDAALEMLKKKINMKENIGCPGDSYLPGVPPVGI